ncbi:hypothetical protein [Halomicrobium urmianum]|uniref:hypothetical protein n=1 Tax=Halomicrobium urmianum TaxID=1586233 RepID=UPI001CD99FB4|nr:hypothetical protein [Halomicrobium urmianum]
MVEDRITDGKRIGQLLASELTGLERGSLADVEVVDAEPDAEPTPDGTVAFGVDHDGERVATAYVHDDHARLAVEGAPGDEVAAEREGDSDGIERDDLDVNADGEGATIRVHSGAAAKRAADALRTVLASRDQ